MKSKRRRFFAIIPSLSTLTPDEQKLVAQGGWPVRVAELLPEHLGFIDFLVRRALEEWERSTAK